ncbi:MAG: VRR-NUC domain-containing protein [Leptospirillum sp.]
MKPFRLKAPVPSEASEQRVLFEWAELNSSRIPELICLFSVPNGGSRHLLEAINLKRTGTKSGIPDVVLPVPRGQFHGLFLELKKTSLRPKTTKSKGGVSETQLDWIIRLRSQGYAVQVCYGASDAISTILRYLSGIFGPQDNFFPNSRVDARIASDSKSPSVTLAWMEPGIFSHERRNE